MYVLKPGTLFNDHFISYIFRGQCASYARVIGKISEVYAGENLRFEVAIYSVWFEPWWIDRLPRNVSCPLFVLVFLVSCQVEVQAANLKQSAGRSKSTFAPWRWQEGVRLNTNTTILLRCQYLAKNASFPLYYWTNFMETFIPFWDTVDTTKRTNFTFYC